jgi:hypothetical protein
MGALKAGWCKGGEEGRCRSEQVRAPRAVLSTRESTVTVSVLDGPAVNGAARRALPPCGTARLEGYQQEQVIPGLVTYT